MSLAVIFLTGPAAAWEILLLAGAAGGTLSWGEWRRPNRPRRTERVVATLTAVGALALAALRPAFPADKPVPGTVNGPEVALWTGGPRPANEAQFLGRVPANLRFRLPGADAPPGAQEVPDVASVRRNLPNPGTLHLVGDGLDPDALADLPPGQVKFHPGPSDAIPRFGFVHAPRVIRPGERWGIMGRVAGQTGPPDGLWTVVLEGPDAFTPVSAPVAADGTFRVTAPGLPTPGNYGWKLRLVRENGGQVSEEEAGGVSVVAPDPPRIYVLESSPHPDTAALRHWLGVAGGNVVTRTEVAAGRYRVATATMAPVLENGLLNATLLRQRDLVLIDLPSLVGLSGGDRRLMREAVETQGTGVLILAAWPWPDVVNKLSGEERNFFLPWNLRPTVATENPDQVLDEAARLVWSGPGGETVSAPEPIPTANARLDSLPGSVDLVTDNQGRTVAARVDRGAGRVALTVVSDSTRWRRAGQPEIFAAFWSNLLTDVAAAHPVGERSGGHWSLAGEGADQPTLGVDGVVDLRWEGPVTDSAPAVGIVTAENAPAGEPATRLDLGRSPGEPTRWAGRFWPRHEGWHQVSTPSGERPLSFYVTSSEAWARARAGARRRASARFTTLGKLPAPAASPAPGAEKLPPVESGLVTLVCFVLFVIPGGFLWSLSRGSD